MGESGVLLLILGNELLADDAVGPWAAQLLAPRLPPQVTLRLCSTAGLELLQELVGWPAAVVVDAVQTGRHPAGTVYRWQLEDLPPVAAPSAHWAGLPEVKAVAQALGLPFPTSLTILAVEVQDLKTVGAPLSRPVAAALPGLVEEILAACSALVFSR
jgi:hydrogenase maturation protease